MDQKQWQQIDALFEAALNRRPEKRPSFLDTACGDDPTLRRIVESLLEWDDQAGDFLEAPAPLVATATDPRLGDLTRQGADFGETVGPYRIEREIARGGMASVYLAARADEEFERKVAIKLLQPGMASASLLQRFLSERQILASLDHPNIARLYEGGRTANGRPYLVMEYIDGKEIDVYCDEHRLSVNQRIELFRKVCAAVHCAHQNLVVHRDIKPSNVLVGVDGEPRLLDFGIAKLLDPEAFPVTLEATVPGQRPMTPNYASPEQVCGGPITTATDVYSLGVLLYKLLSGRLPHRFTGLSPLEIERVLKEEEAPKPSTTVTRVFGDGQPEADELSRQRAARPQQLRRQLAGDLDNIVLMALRKEPSRRYGSAEQLSQDLYRYLTGRPVLARHDTLLYQLSKFLRRHRLAVGVAGLVLALIIVFAAAMAWQASETARQRDRAELERDKAEQVSEFLVGIFREADPRYADGASLTVREFLERGALKIEQELEDQPEVRASLQDAVGSVYTHLGDLQRAADLLEAALATRESHLGHDHLDVAESLLHVADLYWRQGRYAEAEPLFARSLAIREAALGPRHPEVARVLRDMVSLRSAQGRFAEAEELGRRAVTIFEGALGKEHLEVATTINVLAGVFFQQGKLDAAEQSLRSALAMMDRAVGKPTMRQGAMLVNLAGLRFQQGDYEEAAALVQRALAINERLLAQDHPNVADNLVTLAQVFYGRGDLAAAEPPLRRALGIYEKALGDDHPSVANCLYELGNLIRRQGRLAEAEPLLERSLAIREGALEAGHPLTAESLRGLADVRTSQGRLREAERLYRRALAIWEQHPKHQSTQGVPQAYASLLRATGRAEAAAELEARALAAGSGSE